MLSRKEIETEMDIILKTPRIFIITLILLLGLFWLLFDKVIYKTRTESAKSRIESLSSTIQLKDATIERLKTEYDNLIKSKNTTFINPAIKYV